MAELDGLLRGLAAGAGDDDSVRVPVQIERVAREANGPLALVVQQQLRFAIAALDQDALDASLRSRVTHRVQLRPKDTHGEAHLRETQDVALDRRGVQLLVLI